MLCLSIQSAAWVIAAPPRNNAASGVWSRKGREAPAYVVVPAATVTGAVAVPLWHRTTQYKAVCVISVVGPRAGVVRRASIDATLEGRVDGARLFSHRSLLVAAVGAHRVALRCLLLECVQYGCV